MAQNPLYLKASMVIKFFLISWLIREDEQEGKRNYFEGS